jgi:cytochrome P450
MHSVSQSPLDPNFVQNPYGFYDEIRALGSIVMWSDYAMPCATSFSAVNAILRDRRFGREAPLDKRSAIPDHLAPFYAIEAHSMLELEPPRHTRLRSLVLRAFTSRRIKALGPDITALCHQLLDGCPAGEFDLLRHLAQPLPVIIIARLLGVPESMAPDLLRWSNAMVAMYQAGRTHQIEVAASAAATDFADFLRGYIAQRRTRPADDLITHLIAAEEDGERLSPEELIATCILLLNAGHEATVHSIGNGVKTLLEHATPLSALAPDAIDGTVEELLRYDPPLHKFTRYAYEDIDVLGHLFRKGDEVACLLACANRDSKHWEDANRFWPNRAVSANQSFGAGLHFCVGAPLARLELKIALPMLFDRFPELRLATPPSYANAYHFHGLTALSVAP